MPKIYLYVRLIFSVSVLSISMFFNGCTSSDNNPTTGETGDWTLVIEVHLRDEFYRPQPAIGPFKIKLAANDRSIKYIIPAGDSMLILNNVPYQQYIASVEKEGYFPATELNSVSNTYYWINLRINLYSIPSPLTRIDSIKCYPNTVSPQVRFKMFTAQTVPQNGTRQVILFAGLDPYVNSTFGTYVFSVNGITQPPGGSEIITNDLYREMHAAGFTTGNRVYITARIKTGSTLAYGDVKTGLTIYENLEENTKTVASFIMP